MGQPRDLHTRDGLFRWPGEASGGCGARAARTLPDAQAVGREIRAFWSLLRNQASAFEPLELDGFREVGQGTLGDNGARFRTLWKRQPYLRHNGEDCLPLLAPFRIHTRSGVVACESLSDAASGRGVLPQSSECAEGSGWQISHPLREQQ